MFMCNSLSTIDSNRYKLEANVYFFYSSSFPVAFCSGHTHKLVLINSIIILVVCVRLCDPFSIQIEYILFLATATFYLIDKSRNDSALPLEFP